jgi:Ca2+-binding RTX toxin-like protein
MVVFATDKTAQTGRFGGRGIAVVAALVLLLAAVGTAQATHTAPDTFGHTTVEQRVDDANGTDDAYDDLGLVGGEDYTVRDPLNVAQPGRATSRQSKAYFAQMTDFQLADEESPARVEFVDPGPSSAWRPQEAFVPYMVEYTVRQVNAFAGDSPFPGSDATMDFSLITGDQADNNHRNETVWIRELLEGGEPQNFDTGIDPTGYDPTLPGCATAQANPVTLARLKNEADNNLYTGVQDHDDYESLTSEAYFYDPDIPADSTEYGHFPQYMGLMDRAQQVTFTPEGLNMPFYLANGNHDVLVQGNEDANLAFERIALGCEKVFGPTPAAPGPGSLPDPDFLFLPGLETAPVPPDPERQLLSKPQIKRIYADGTDPAADPEQGHGFGLVDPAENAASNGSASYYSWEPITGMQFISIDTNSEGGQTAEGVAPGSSNGNIDDPQFQWLKGELEAAQAANKLIVLFGHHPVRSMNTPIIDEQASPCTVDDSHGHDINPGCDIDPRASTPIHLGDEELPGTGQTFVELLDGYPNVIAYVPGHTHEHRLTPFQRQDGSLWWELNTSAVVDHPTQSRLIEVFDNQDGTLSIFTNVIDHGSSSAAPPPGSAAGFDENQLASIGRTLAYNDLQNNFSGEGAVEDRNAELLLGDPRDDNQGGGPGPKEKCKGKQATIVGTGGKDRLEGTSGDDVIVAKGGKDKVTAGKGKDVICGNGGKDKLSGNGGKDKVRGGGGKDKLGGGGGKDKLKGGAGRDTMRGGGGRDSCGGGPGRDVGRSCEQGRDADD